MMLLVITISHMKQKKLTLAEKKARDEKNARVTRMLNNSMAHEGGKAPKMPSVLKHELSGKVAR